MKKNRVDIFEGKKETYNPQSENFFLSESAGFVSGTFDILPESTKRLNDYDFNLLREDAYKDIEDELFKLEYKISKIENDIKVFDAQIQAANDIGDVLLIEDLNSRKYALTNVYNELLLLYKDKSLSAKITDSLSNAVGYKIKNKFNVFREIFLKLTESISKKMPKRISVILELRKTLNQLENLNKSVDELMSLNIPYGENYNKYEQLSKYIIKANSIQAELTRNMKK